MPGAKGEPACPDAVEETLPPATVAAAIRNTRDVYFADRDRFMGLLCLQGTSSGGSLRRAVGNGTGRTGLDYLTIDNEFAC
jgi:hypothetical protein